MQRITMIFAMLAIFTISSLQARAETEFAEGQIAINAGITYGFDIEEPGIRLGATYFLNENMRVGGDLTYWLIGDETFIGTTFSFTYLEINGNFNYLFYNQDDLVLYGIGALGIHYASVSVGGDSESDTELGLGLGAGVEYNIGPLSIFAEPKLFLSGFDQAKFNLGVRFYL